MNREQIIQMAREQGLPETARDGVFIVNSDDLGRILAAERKRLADKIEAMPFGDTAASFAVWIRNGGEG
jgi:glycerol-3-phosphate responsive antiterminator